MHRVAGTVGGGAARKLGALGARVVLLDSDLRRLRRHGTWTEIVALVIPGQNDSEAEARALAPARDAMAAAVPASTIPFASGGGKPDSKRQRPGLFEENGQHLRGRLRGRVHARGTA